MLGAMLGSTPGGICLPESQFMNQLLEEPIWEGGQADAFRACEFINRHRRFQLWEVPPLDPQHWPDRITFADIWWRVARHYARAQRCQSMQYWVDHTPSNTRYVATWRETLPGVKFVHIVRDVRGVAASLLRLPWGPVTPEFAARFWLERLTPGLAAELTYPDLVTRVRYEDIVVEPERELRRLCGDLGLQYQPGMVEGGGFAVPSYTADQHALVGRQPSVDRVNAWEQSLTPRDVEIIESVVGDTLTLLGYRAVYGTSARRSRGLERFKAQIHEIYGSIRTRVERRRRMVGARRGRDADEVC
jgi:hypothetical protein